ncbi:fatty acid desaturase-domain-containing protein [Pholiota molesta]|nr:fatty acid desaturase-domain-containing protein [Pholiota molesta]
MYFRNGPEYEARLKRPFAPPTVSLKEIHDAVPKHLLKKNEPRAALYIVRDIVFTLFLYKFATSITPWAATDFGGYVTGNPQKTAVKTALWLSYWWVQGMVNAGIFCLGHDAGHTSMFENNVVNNIVGFFLHTWLLIPYYSWRATHHAHHKATASMERDENYVPYTRSQFKLADEKTVKKADYEELFEETPIYTAYRLFIMQAFGWWIYLANNTMGSPMYPPGTNHFDPMSPLFKKEQRFNIFMSDLGLLAMSSWLYYMGREFFLWNYLVPWILVNHWIVMFTFLHHSDPTIPHYRKGEWSFLRGAAATVDRPLLGWMGRFFFHNISHDHVAHHFFLRAPFWNGPEITKAVRSVLGDSYNYDSTPTFYALYRSFSQCLFIEDEGEIIFYKNKDGIAQREVAESVLKEIKEKGWNPEEQDRLDTFEKAKAA